VRSVHGSDGAVIVALNEVVAKHQLNLPRRTKRRVPQRERHSLVAPAPPNAVRAVDFISNTFYDGRCFRTPKVLDQGVHEGLAIKVDTRLRHESG